MANARKLPSGSWRVRISAGKRNGKYIYESFTAPTKREAERMAAEWAMERESRPESMTVESAIDKYIMLKEPRLSPSTIRGYVRYQRHYYDSLNSVYIRKISVDILQDWINEQAEMRSPKTVRNAYGLLSAALEMFGCRSFKVQLPALSDPDLYTPSDEDIRKLIEYISRNPDKTLLRAVMLAAFCSLRRGEICALESSDIDGHIIHVTKDLVADRDGKLIVKPPKTKKSVRDIAAPAFVVDLMPEHGRICPLTPKQLTDRFRRAVKASGCPHFRFHDLRHYYVSIAHAIGIPDAYIMESGGWSTPAVMNRVYKSTLSGFRERNAAALSNHFSEIYDTNYDTQKNKSTV